MYVYRPILIMYHKLNYNSCLQDMTACKLVITTYSN